MKILWILILLFTACSKMNPDCAICTTMATVYFNVSKDGYPKVYSDSIKRCDISIEKFERINKVNTPPMEEKIDTLIMYTKVETRCRWIKN